MEQATGLSRETMLRAVDESDAAYDGQFFFCVHTTGIYCFPSCSARRPKPESVSFVRTREEAESLGFRPCKRCHSDVDGGRERYGADIVARAQSLIDQDLPNAAPALVASFVGFSVSHLNRLFRRHTGHSLNEYIRHYRVERAAELLLDSEQSILDIALAVGYQSASSLYESFRREFGVAPGEYRKQLGERD